MILLATLALAGVPTIGRLAICHDGNYHDLDDVGSVAMMEALLWHAGAQDKLVHLDHSAHRGANIPAWNDEMEMSAGRFAHRFGIDGAVIYDAYWNARGAVLNLADAIEASTAADRLVILQAGPWHLMSIAFEVSDPAAHQYVTVVSHSDWNDDHEHFASHLDKADFFAQYQAGGQFFGYTPPTYIRIEDQNDYAFKSALSDWSWLQATPETRFVYNRSAASGFAAGDMSDAGMLFWLLTGNETPTMGEVRGWFGL